jgi:hypothetical protein
MIGKKPSIKTRFSDGSTGVWQLQQVRTNRNRISHQAAKAPTMAAIAGHAALRKSLLIESRDSPLMFSFEDDCF